MLGAAGEIAFEALTKKETTPGGAPAPGPNTLAPLGTGAPSFLVSDEHFSELFYASVRFTTDTTKPADWPDASAIRTATGEMRRLADLWTVPTSSKYGMYDFIWVIAKLNEFGSVLNDDPGDGTSNASFVTAWDQIADEAGDIPVEAPDLEEDRPQPVANCLVMLLLYMASGTLTGKNQEGRNQTMISQASINPTCANSKLFYNAFSRFASADWLSAVVSDVLFTSSRKVQSYFDTMGPLVKKYLTSHSSAGSSFFERMNHLHETLGLEPAGVLKVYQVLSEHDLLPAFAVAHTQRSFASKELEGVLYCYTLFRLAGLIALDESGRRRLTKVLTRAFCDALDLFKEGDAKKYSNAFGRTLNSGDARDRLKSKMMIHAPELSQPNHTNSLHAIFANLDFVPLRTTHAHISYDSAKSITESLRGPGLLPPTSGDLAPFLEREIAVYVNTKESTDRMLWYRTTAELKRVAKRFQGLGERSKGPAFTDRLFDLFKNFAETEVAPIEGETNDLLINFPGIRILQG